MHHVNDYKVFHVNQRLGLFPGQQDTLFTYYLRKEHNHTVKKRWLHVRTVLCGMIGLKHVSNIKWNTLIIVPHTYMGLFLCLYDSVNMIFDISSKRSPHPNHLCMTGMKKTQEDTSLYKAHENHAYPWLLVSV